MLIIKDGTAYSGLLCYILGIENKQMTRFWRNHIGEKIVVILKSKENE